MNKDEDSPNEPQLGKSECDESVSAAQQDAYYELEPDLSLPRLVELLGIATSTEGAAVTPSQYVQALLQAVERIATDEDDEATDALISIIDKDDSEEIREKAGKVLGNIGRLNALRKVFQQIEITYHWGQTSLEGTFFPIFRQTVRSMAVAIGSQAVPMLEDALRDELSVFSGIDVHKAPEMEHIFHNEIGFARQKAAAHALAWFIEHDPDLVDEEVREKVGHINVIMEEEL